MSKQFKFSALLLLVGLFVGLFFAAQLQATPSRLLNLTIPLDSQQAKSLAQSSLEETHQGLLLDQETLRGQLRSEQQATDTLEQSSTLAAKLSGNLGNQLEAAKRAAGLSDLSGPGIDIVLADARGQSSADRVITAADIRDIISALWASGAKAIAIGGERLVETSSIDAVAETILVNNTRILPPFHITALGDPLVLHGQLVDPRQLTDLHRRASSVGIQFDIFERNTLTVPAYTGNLYPQVAKPEVRS